jgi:hypothetical protein
MWQQTAVGVKRGAFSCSCLRAAALPDNEVARLFFVEAADVEAALKVRPRF